MKTTSLSLAAAVLLLIASCSKDESPTAPSTNKQITVSLTGATAYNGKTFGFALFQDSMPHMPFAFDARTIASGQSSVTLSAPADRYMVGVFIDLNGNIAVAKWPEQGEPAAADTIMLSADTSMVYNITDL